MNRYKNVVSNILKVAEMAYKEDKKLFIGYFLTSILGALLIFIIYFLYKLLIDEVLKNISVDLPLIILLLISAYLIVEYLSRTVYFLANRYFFDEILRFKFQFALTRRFMAKIVSLDFANLENGEVRNLIAKVNDTYTWRVTQLFDTSNFLVYNIFGIILSLIIALRFNIYYFLILAAVSTPLYFFRAKYGNATWSVYSKRSNDLNFLWYLRNIFTNFQTIPEIKIYNLKDYLLSKTKTVQDDIMHDYRRAITKYTVLSTLGAILVPVVLFFIIKDIIFRIAVGQLTIGDFTFLVSVLFTFTEQISNLFLNIGTISENNLYANDYFNLMSLENKIKEKPDAYKFPDIKPRKIEFRNVTFTYPEQKLPSLTNINFTIEKGENIAIVGKNGAGKTTIIKLIFRFYDPQSGEILIDGISLRDLDLDNWYKHLGVLFQDFPKYNFTLKENIQFGNIHEASEEKIKENLNLVQGKDILTDLPKGFDNILGKWFKEGKDLSVGQWQKVAIARALYRQSPILILDEPTSNIDAEAEYKIFLNLKKIYKEKSLVFISHRFSTVRMADKIFVVEDGKIEEEGTHEELLKHNNLYAKYFNLQKKGYE